MGRLPEPLARSAASGVARAMARRGGPALAMSERHVRRVFESEAAGVVADPALVRRVSRRTYMQYAQYWVDGSRLPYTDPSVVRARMAFERGEEILREAMSLGRGVVLALPHLGSWEWGGAWLALNDMPMTAVVERIDPPRLFEWFIGQRAEMGLTAVPMGEGSAPAMLRALRGCRGRTGLRPGPGGQRGRGRVLRRADHTARGGGHSGPAYGRAVASGGGVRRSGQLAHWSGGAAARYHSERVPARRRGAGDPGPGHSSSRG